MFFVSLICVIVGGDVDKGGYMVFEIIGYLLFLS